MEIGGLSEVTTVAALKEAAVRLTLTALWPRE